ncbi:MAG: hypothetical protein LBU22_00815 [Dysgonamonadaceae bacterium]|jgi:hypothetical protein|nr:hypothetical protein [Dysgonamonadaceae bacterium]
MKKLIYFIGFLLYAQTALMAQEIIPEKQWTVPAVYAFDEEVTWYFDFASASALPDGGDLYMWIWVPKNPIPDATPENLAKTKLHYDGDRIWSITFTPTTFFGMTVDEIKANTESSFYFLLRSLDFDTYHSGTLSFYKTDFIGEFANSGKVIDFAPTDFRLNSTISILFNSNLVDGFNPVPSTLHMHGGLNDWDAAQSFDAWLPEIREKTQFKNMGNGIYKKDLIPQTYFGVTEEYVMENIAFVIAKYNGNDASPDWAGASPDFKIIAPGVPIPPPANLYFFPIKVSINDILTITRENNDRGQRLFYTITGGSKTLSGDLEGAMTSQRVMINLAKEFKGINVSKLTVLIKDQNNKSIYDGDITLMKVDNPTK